MQSCIVCLGGFYQSNGGRTKPNLYSIDLRFPIFVVYYVKLDSRFLFHLFWEPLYILGNACSYWRDCLRARYPLGYLLVMLGGYIF